MTSCWQDADDNTLLAQMQEASLERNSRGMAQDYAYSDEEFAALVAEIGRRRARRRVALVETDFNARTKTLADGATAEHQTLPS